MTIPTAAMSFRVLLLLACLWASLLSGCGRDTPESLVASAKAANERKDHKAATVSLMAALQQDPGNHETRMFLAEQFLKSADPAGAAIELEKLRSQDFPKERVTPVYATTLLLLGEERQLVRLYADTSLADAKAQASLKASLATAYMALGDIPRARAALELSLKADPSNTAARVVEARLAVAKSVDEGVKLAQAIVAREPNAYDAWFLLGELQLHGLRDSAAAVTSFQKSLAIEPANVQVHLALISDAIRRQDLEGARAQTEKLRKVLPRHPQMVFVDAQMAYQERDLTKAREMSQALLKLAPDHVGILQLAGAVAGELDNLLLAQTHFAKALQINPGLPLARRNLAQVYLRLGQPTRAFETLKPMLTKPATDAAAVSLAAEAALAAGMIDVAVQLFNDAAKLSPSDERLKAALALARMQRGNAEQAFADLARLADGSRSTHADQAIISARIQRGEYDQALAAVAELERKNPPDPTLAPSLRGRIHALRGDLAASRKAFDQVLAAKPGFFSAIASLASLDLREGKPDEALRRFTEAISADPKNIDAYIGKAEILIRRRAPFAEVRTLLGEAVKAAPNNPDPRLQLIEYGLKTRQTSEALAAAQNAAAAVPDDLRILDAFGRALSLSGDRLQALSVFQRAANLDPNSATPHVRMADLYRVDGKVPQAVLALRRALEIDPNLAEAQVSLFRMLTVGGKTEEALAVAKALQRNPAAIEGGYLLEAALHGRRRNWARAEAVLREGLKAHPGSGAIAVRLMQVMTSAGRPDEAERFAAQWERDKPEEPEVAYKLAIEAITKGDLEAAEKRLRFLVERHPAHPLALNNLAWVLTTAGKPGAVPFAERALARLPDNPGVKDTLAMAMAAEGQAKQALVLQQEAVAASPEDAGLRLNLARIAVKAGDTKLAKTELSALVEKGPSGPFHKEASQLLATL